MSVKISYFNLGFCQNSRQVSDLDGSFRIDTVCSIWNEEYNPKNTTSRTFKIHWALTFCKTSKYFKKSRNAANERILHASDVFCKLIGKQIKNGVNSDAFSIRRLQEEMDD